MGYRSIRRCDPKEIRKIWKFRERLIKGGISEDERLTTAQVLEFAYNTKREHESARDYVAFGDKGPDRDGMDSMNKFIQKSNKDAIRRNRSIHFASVPELIQDVHGNQRLIHFLRIVSGKDAIDAGIRFDTTYRPKINHLKHIGRNPKVKQELKRKLREIKQEAGIN